MPFQFTVEEDMKFVPATVKVIAGLPTTADVGLIEVKVGTGFGGTLIVNAIPAEVPPPGDGFVTVTVAVPAVAKSDAGTCTERELELA